MTTYLINHLCIPNEVPNDGLEYLEQVEATFQPGFTAAGFAERVRAAIADSTR